MSADACHGWRFSPRPPSSIAVARSLFFLSQLVLHTSTSCNAVEIGPHSGHLIGPVLWVCVCVTHAAILCPAESFCAPLHTHTHTTQIPAPHGIHVDWRTWFTHPLTLLHVHYLEASYIRGANFKCGADLRGAVARDTWERSPRYGLLCFTLCPCCP